MDKTEIEEVLAAVLGYAPNDAGWIRINCPLCASRTLDGRGDRRNSMRVSVTTGRYSCFRCDAFGFVPLDELDEMDTVADFILPESSTEIATIAPPESFAYIGHEPALSAYVYRRARRYLESRHLSEAAWRKIGIGACLEGYHRDRVVVPIMSVDRSRWIGWVARDYTGNAERKYLYPMGMKRSVILYQEHVLDVETSTPCLVVEGVFDTFPYWGDSVAVLGKPSPQQLRRLSRAKRPVVFVFDGDAWEEGEACANKLLLDGCTAGFVRLEAGVDPDEVNTKKLMADAVASL